MKRELWLRLKQYHFDHLVPAHLTDRVRAAFSGADASTQAFATKLVRKLDWKRGFALRAIHEYKKFVYLGIVSENSVTPPKVIDQVWHEHLLFTRAYRDFCRDVLGRDFDHNPELVPSKSQNAVFERQFTATLERYHFEFGKVPPADIWGTPKFVADALSKAALEKKKSTAMVPRIIEDGSSASVESDPLYSFFGAGSGVGESTGHADGFGGGGGFSGGGSGDSWDSASDSGSSSSSSDSSGSDSGGDSGGSSCSSSCGSSCGGGGGD